PRPQDAFDGSFEMQTVRQVVEWKAPARFDDVIEVSIRGSRLGTTSFTLSCELRRAGEADVLATIETIYVHVDAQTWKKREIAPEMRAALEAGAAGKHTDHAGQRRCGEDFPLPILLQKGERVRGGGSCERRSKRL